MSLTSDLSDISLTDKDMRKTPEEAMSSDSEESVTPMDETPDLAGSQTSMSTGSSLVNPSEEKNSDSMMLDTPASPEVDAEDLALGEEGKKDRLGPGEMQNQKSQCDKETLSLSHLDSDSSPLTASETLNPEQVGNQIKSKNEVQKDEPNSMPRQRDKSKKPQSQQDASNNKTQSQKDASNRTQLQKNALTDKTQSQKDSSSKTQSQKDMSSKTQSQKDSSNKTQGQTDSSNKTQGQKDSSNKAQGQKDLSNKTQVQKDKNSSNKTQGLKNALTDTTQCQKDSGSKTQPVLDQNANVDQSENANAGPGTQTTKSLNQEKKPGMVFGPQSKPEVKPGHTLDYTSTFNVS